MVWPHQAHGHEFRTDSVGKKALRGSEGTDLSLPQSSPQSFLPLLLMPLTQLTQVAHPPPPPNTPASRPAACLSLLAPAPSAPQDFHNSSRAWNQLRF